MAARRMHRVEEGGEAGSLLGRRKEDAEEVDADGDGSADDPGCMYDGTSQYRAKLWLKSGDEPFE